MKEALRLLTTLYPELLEKIYFHNAPWWFSPIFSIFSMWVKKDTRKKFVFVKKGSPVTAFYTIAPEHVSVDFGGTGPSLRGENGPDEFVKRAVRKYDEEVLEYLKQPQTNSVTHIDI